MILTSSSESIKVVLSGAVTTNQLQCYVSYMVSIDGLDPVNRSFTLTNNTTAVTLLAGYSATSGIPTEILRMSIFNSDTAAATPSVSFATPESGTYVLFKKELQPGESLQYTKEEGFFLANSEMPKGKVVAENSGTLILASGATFTGTWVDVSAYATYESAVTTDQNGTLYIEFSPDGTNIDSSIPYLYKTTFASNPPHGVAVTRKYARTRFTNTSASNQTYFRLQTLVGNQTLLRSPLNSTINPSADAIIVRPLDFNMAVAEGLYQNRQPTIKDGLTGTIANGNVTEDLWTNGGAYTGFPSAAAAAELVIAGADTGTVYYSYMATDTDTDYTMTSKAIAGAGTYALGHNIWRCNFMYFEATTVTAFNVGLMTIRHVATPANIFVSIPIGYGQSYCAAYTVPYGSYVLVDRFNGNMKGSATGSLDGWMYYKPYGAGPRLRFPFELQFGSLYFDDVDYLIRIPERVDFIPRITVSSAPNLTGKYSFRLVKVKI